MIQHQSYFEALSTLDETSPSWLSTLSGLAVLERVSAIRQCPAMASEDWMGATAVEETVARIGEGNPLRRSLQRVMQGLRSENPAWSEVAESLFSYGHALDLDGSWTLAVDVFDTVANIARSEHDAKLAVEATTALGGAARRSGDWEKSAEGYADAAHLASALGDNALGLTVRVGTANTLVARGNLRDAREIFDEIIAEADAAHLDGVMGLALHGRSAVASLEKNHAEALALAYRALEKTRNPSARDTITADIAASFLELGMRDAGRDAYMVLSLTSRYQWVRWQATINLMELAAIDGMEDVFDRHASGLADAALDPRLKAYYLLYYGIGCAQFGRHLASRDSLQQARDYAAAHKIHQVVFQAEAALVAAEKKTSPIFAAETAQSRDISPDMQHVADEFANLRDTAMSSFRADDWG